MIITVHIRSRLGFKSLKDPMVNRELCIHGRVVSSAEPEQQPRAEAAAGGPGEASIKNRSRGFR